MASRDYRVYLRSAFEPFTEVCNKTALLKQLRTQHLPADRRDIQFGKFRTLKVDPGNVVPIPGGGFIGVLIDEVDQILLVSSPSLNEQEIRNLEAFLIDDQSMLLAEFDEASFLITAHELKGYFNVKENYRAREHSLQFIDIVDDDYEGHSIDDLRNAYHDVNAFRMTPENINHGSEVSRIAVKVLASVPALRSPIFDKETGNAVAGLVDCAGCSADNIFQALTASQWRHAFLDIYRCLESLFFFPWMRDLSGRIGTSVDFRTLRDHCRNQLGWNAKELDSLRRLFDCSDHDELRDIEKRTHLFNSLAGDKKATRQAYAAKVYFARNALVHHEDRDQPDIPAPTASDYQKLTLYLSRFLFHFNTTHGRNLKVDVSTS